jgi:hypothetical protein
MEGLLVGTIRSDRQSVAELKAKAGDIATWLFIRRKRQCPLAVAAQPVSVDGSTSAPATGAVPPVRTDPQKVRSIWFSSRLWMEECLLGPAQGLIWTAGLSEPLALLFAHGWTVLEGRFNEHLKGLLGSPPPGRAKPEKKHRGETQKKDQDDDRIGEGTEKVIKKSRSRRKRTRRGRKRQRKL